MSIPKDTKQSEIERNKQPRDKPGQARDERGKPRDERALRITKAISDDNIELARALAGGQDCHVPDLV